ncbi:MAG: hypothetical protein AAFZ63_21865 [Bacteroidota bacterium]
MTRRYLLVILSGIVTFASCKKSTELTDYEDIRTPLSYFDGEQLCLCLIDQNGNMNAIHLDECVQNNQDSLVSMGKDFFNSKIVTTNDSVRIEQENGKTFLGISISTCLNEGRKNGFLHKIVTDDGVTKLMSMSLRVKLADPISSYLKENQIGSGFMEDRLPKFQEMPRLSIIRFYRINSNWGKLILYSNHRGDAISKIINSESALFEDIKDVLEKTGNVTEAIFPISFYETDQLQSYEEFKHSLQ